jgi:ubiquinone/menaquinone biosynthesis C-methylase UbiE
MTEKNDEYLKALQVSSEETKAYYKKSVVKTEQQKFLEKLLAQTGIQFSAIADIACGGGSLTFHLRSIFPKAHFTLCDYNADGLVLAKELNGENCNYLQGNIYDLSGIKDNSFDLVCCWQTLSWLDEPEKALHELIRIAKPGGKIFASSLFNLDHEVDIYAKVMDHTLPSGQQGLSFSYNTYAAKSVEKWVAGKVKNFQLHKFIPEIDFKYDGHGIGTFTVQTEKGRLQISGGYLMNWAILELTK